MTSWKKERCSNRPDDLQIIAPGTYMQRKDIREVPHTAMGDEPEFTGYECMSREISVSEYEMLQSIEAINTDKAIDDYTLELIEMGVL